MGQHANDLLNGDFDSITGEYIGEGDGYPRTRQKDNGVHYYEPSGQYTRKELDTIDHNPEKYIKGTRKIRKELAILINEEKAKIPDITPKQENLIVNACRKAMNDKYGKGWREQI